jgi:hypothetical protein
LEGGAVRHAYMESKLEKRYMRLCIPPTIGRVFFFDLTKDELIKKDGKIVILKNNQLFWIDPAEGILLSSDTIEGLAEDGDSVLFENEKGCSYLPISRASDGSMKIRNGNSFYELMDNPSVKELYCQETNKKYAERNTNDDLFLV